MSNLRFASLVFRQAALPHRPSPPGPERKMKACWGDAVNKVVGILMTGFLPPFPLLPFWHSNNDPVGFAVWHPLAFLAKNGGGHNKGQVHPTPSAHTWWNTKRILIKAKQYSLKTDGLYLVKRLNFRLLLCFHLNLVRSRCFSQTSHTVQLTYAYPCSACSVHIGRLSVNMPSHTITEIHDWDDKPRARIGHDHWEEQVEFVALGRDSAVGKADKVLACVCGTLVLSDPSLLLLRQNRSSG